MRNIKFSNSHIIIVIGFILISVIVGVAVEKKVSALVASENNFTEPVDEKQAVYTPLPTKVDVVEDELGETTGVPLGEDQFSLPTPEVALSEFPLAQINDIKGVLMRLVPSGQFIMGGGASTSFAECQKFYIVGICDLKWFDDEEPAHTVYLDDFYMDVFEVSNLSYKKCVNEGVCDPPTDNSSSSRPNYFNNPEFEDYPVIHVDWFMANAYCEWRGTRLPTEAEWEKAARGINGSIYPWGDVFDGQMANFCDSNCQTEEGNKSYDDGYADTSPVDSYPGGITMYGIFNLSGNVWEWVADWYGETYYTESQMKNPTGPASGVARVARGGSWRDFGDVLRAMNRNWVRATFTDSVLGFRCVR